VSINDKTNDIIVKIDRELVMKTQSSRKMAQETVLRLFGAADQLQNIIYDFLNKNIRDKDSFDIYFNKNVIRR
jgi:hypothetical protein